MTRSSSRSPIPATWRRPPTCPGTRCPTARRSPRRARSWCEVALPAGATTAAYTATFGVTPVDAARYASVVDIELAPACAIQGGGAPLAGPPRHGRGGRPAAGHLHGPGAAVPGHRAGGCAPRRPARRPRRGSMPAPATTAALPVAGRDRWGAVGVRLPRRDRRGPHGGAAEPRARARGGAGPDRPDAGQGRRGADRRGPRRAPRPRPIHDAAPQGTVVRTDPPAGSQVARRHGGDAAPVGREPQPASPSPQPTRAPRRPRPAPTPAADRRRPTPTVVATPPPVTSRASPKAPEPTDVHLRRPDRRSRTRSAAAGR